MTQSASLSRRTRRVSGGFRPQIFTRGLTRPPSKGPMKGAQFRKLKQVCNFENLRPTQQVECKSPPKSIEFLSKRCAATLELTLQRAAAESQLPGSGLKTDIASREAVAQNSATIVQEVVFRGLR